MTEVTTAVNSLVTNVQNVGTVLIAVAMVSVLVYAARLAAKARAGF